MEDVKYFVFETTDEFKRLINYLYSNAECIDKEILNNDEKKYVLITKESLFKAIEGKSDFIELAEKLCDSEHTCYNCGCVSNIFLMDYRGQECTSKVYSCPFCYTLNDESYHELNRTKDVLKYI